MFSGTVCDPGFQTRVAELPDHSKWHDSTQVLLCLLDPGRHLWGHGLA